MVVATSLSSPSAYALRDADSSKNDSRPRISVIEARISFADSFGFAGIPEIRQIFYLLLQVFQVPQCWPQTIVQGLFKIASPDKGLIKRAIDTTHAVDRIRPIAADDFFEVDGQVLGAVGLVSGIETQ